MPTEAEHVEKHRLNRALPDGPPALAAASGPWAATVAFYAAVHLIERLAAREGRHHSKQVGPTSRNVYLANHPAHRAVQAEFAALLSASMVARYESAPAFAAAYPGDTGERVLVGKCLAVIESHVVAHCQSP